jgi:hypothetical protein
MFFDSAAKNYPGTLREQNKYSTFDILANPNASHLQEIQRSWSSIQVLTNLV